MHVNYTMSGVIILWKPKIHFHLMNLDWVVILYSLGEIWPYWLSSGCDMVPMITCIALKFIPMTPLCREIPIHMHRPTHFSSPSNYKEGWYKREGPTVKSGILKFLRKGLLGAIVGCRSLLLIPWLHNPLHMTLQTKMHNIYHTLTIV